MNVFLRCWLVGVLLLITGCVRSHRLPVENPDSVTPDDAREINMEDTAVNPESDLPIRIDDSTDRSAPWLTRDDLARILDQRFSSLMPRHARPPVMIDIDQSDQQESLIVVVSAGLFPVGRDHRIMPKSRIRKLDLARIIWRLMDLTGSLPDEVLMLNVMPAPDITTAHAMQKEVTGCRAAGILEVEEDGRFQSGRVLTGKEILRALDDLENYIDQPSR